MSNSGDICIVCHTDEDLFLLPCYTCNNDSIENKKWIHSGCWEEAITSQEFVNHNARCPYCGTYSISIRRKIDWIQTLDKFFDRIDIVDVFWIIVHTITIILSIIHEVPDGIIIDDISFIVVRFVVVCLAVLFCRTCVEEFFNICKVLVTMEAVKINVPPKLH